MADGRALPWDDAAFDGVVFATTPCHVPGPEAALAEARRVLRPGGWLLIDDGDHVTTTVALRDGDPLQICVAAGIRTLVHDPRLVRRLTTLVRGTGFVPGEPRSHGHLEPTTPAYMLSLIDLGADRLVHAGTLTVVTAEALEAEARARVAAGTFFGHIAYASLLATRP